MARTRTNNTLLQNFLNMANEFEELFRRHLPNWLKVVQYFHPFYKKLHLETNPNSTNICADNQAMGWISIINYIEIFDNLESTQKKTFKVWCIDFLIISTPINVTPHVISHQLQLNKQLDKLKAKKCNTKKIMQAIC